MLGEFARFNIRKQSYFKWDSSYHFLFHSFDDRLSKLDPKTGRLVCHTKSERPIYMHADIVFVKKKLPPYPRIKLSMGKSSLG
jgi:hypothetical protein